MEIKKFIKQIVSSLFSQEIQELKESIQKQNILIEANNTLSAKINVLNEDIEALKSQIGTLQSQIPRESSIDTFCKAHFKKIPNIAYKEKREINGKPYSIFLNEIIQPDSFEVQKFKRGLELTGNALIDAKKIGDKVAQWMTWDSDNNLSKSGDYYLTPSETLCRRLGDCEDHANIVASIGIGLGVAYGYAKNIGWHAFNVFVYQDILYVLDTVEDSALTSIYDKSDYDINYIITKDNTYEIDGSLSFGIIAGGKCAKRYKIGRAHV